MRLSFKVYTNFKVHNMNFYISPKTCLCKQNSKYVNKGNNVGEGRVKGAWNIPDNDIVAKLANSIPHFHNDEGKESLMFGVLSKIEAPSTNFEFGPNFGKMWLPST
jgi:hypothetical protein